MTRRVFNLAAMLSLMICLATAVMCIRGRSVVDNLGYACAPGKSGQMIHNVFFGKGCVCIASMNISMDYGGLPVGFSAYGGDAHSIVEYYPGGRSRFGGFGLRLDRLVIPYWAIVLLTAAIPLGRLVAPRRKSHALGQLCAKCGYDLRATPEKSGPLFDRCPECGMSAPHAKTVT